jgi:hypothetical protein
VEGHRRPRQAAKRTDEVVAADVDDESLSGSSRGRKPSESPINSWRQT